MSTTKKPQSLRQFVCEYILADFPGTLYRRWFRSISAARAYANRLHHVVYVDVHHA